MSAGLVLNLPRATGLVVDLGGGSIESSNFQQVR